MNTDICRSLALLLISYYNPEFEKSSVHEELGAVRSLALAQRTPPTRQVPSVDPELPWEGFLPWGR